MGVLILVALNAPELITPVVTVPVKVGEATGAAPKLVKAAAAVVAPVPPLAIAKVPVTDDAKLVLPELELLAASPYP